MSMPPRPIPHFILIQAGLPFPFFQTFLDLPPGSRHFRHSIEWGIDRVGYRSSGVSIEWGIDRVGYRSSGVSIEWGIDRVGYRSSGVLNEWRLKRAGSRASGVSIEWGIDRVGYRSSGVSIEWGIDRGVREVVSEFYRFRERPPSDEPPFFTGQTVPLLDHSAARPIVEAKTLLAFRDGKPFPLLRGLARHHGFHRFRWGGLRA